MASPKERTPDEKKRLLTELRSIIRMDLAPLKLVTVIKKFALLKPKNKKKKHSLVPLLRKKILW